MLRSDGDIMSRAEFSSIKTDDPELFVVKVKGHLGVKERGRVEELLRKCDEKNKNKVIFEFTEVESLGGSIAKMIGGFITERTARGCPPAFVGCSRAVENFLTGRCDRCQPSFLESLEAGREFLSSAGASKPEESPAPPSRSTNRSPPHAISAFPKLSRLSPPHVISPG